MISLKIQDKYDGSSKVNELRGGIGDTFCDNHSSTGWSRLVEVSKDGEIAYTEEVKSEYHDKKPVKRLKKQPTWLVWNGMFY